MVALLGLVACGVGKSDSSSCEQYRDDVIERRLNEMSVPNVGEARLAAEMDKHRAVLMRVHGTRLIKECQEKRR